MNKDKLSIDVEAVDLLKRVQVNLASALDSLAGKTTEAEASYLVWGAAHINKTIAGYIVLREARLLHASKLLVRPVLETTFYACAVLRERGFLLQKAYSEFLEDAKIAAANDADRAALKLKAKEEFERLMGLLTVEQPNYPQVECKKVGVEDAAAAASLTQAYQFDFRLYCQFMHGALRATSGDLDSLTDKRDTPLMIWCALIVCEELKTHTPAEVSDLACFWNELHELPDPTCSGSNT